MKKSKYIKGWDHSNSPLLWVELIYIGDTKKMPESFGFRYNKHYFISHNQTTTFYKNTDTEKRAREYGAKKYKDEKFIKLFIAKARKSEKRLNGIIKKITTVDFKKINTEQLYKIYEQFFDNYATIMGIYRFCRPDFYEQVVEEIKKKLPEPKNKNLVLLLKNEFGKIKIDNKTKKIAVGLKQIGEKRFELHKLWVGAYIKASKLFITIGKQIGLNSLEVQNCTKDEIEKYLLKFILPNRQEIKERIKRFKFIYHDNYFEIIIPKGKKERQIKLKEFKGVAAFSGVAKGKVVMLKESLSGVLQKDMQKISKGDILVTEMTSPDMVPAMKKSAAIVTDDGGMLCHAAIVAREMKKPCIIGTKIATKILKNGDFIEVNATNGIVKIIKRNNE